MELQIIDKRSAEYPKRLRDIHDPPEKLYCQGDISLLQSRTVAVVGSRKYTLYGKNVTLMIGKRLAENDVTTVSGLALGVDAFSHEGALDAGGRVIGVLGSGIDMMTPYSNRKLMKRGLDSGGLVVSEYPQGTPPYRSRFPARNRIISGLSEAVIIVEADLNSGSLITAKHAAEQGRCVYAVPGNINSQSSIGCNLLIRDGAVPLIIIDDVIRDLGMETKSAKPGKQGLETDEQKIFESAARRGGATLDEISSDSGLSVPLVSSLVTVMEIKGIVQSYAGRIYVAG